MLETYKRDWLWPSIPWPNRQFDSVVQCIKIHIPITDLAAIGKIVQVRIRIMVQSRVTLVRSRIGLLPGKEDLHEWDIRRRSILRIPCA
jgi:hypothetical protein